MSELLKVIVGVALVFWLVADGADESISNEVMRECLVYNVEQKSLGRNTSSFCACTGNMTAHKADLLLKFMHQIGAITIDSPYNLGKEIGEQTKTACNAINGATP